MANTIGLTQSQERVFRELINKIKEGNYTNEEKDLANTLEFCYLKEDLAYGEKTK